MNGKVLVFIQDQIGYQFKNINLLEQAFTRESFSQENGGENNEVLEFIGDKVLDLVAVKYLTEKFGRVSERSGVYESEYTENELTEYKRRLVERYALSDRIEWLQLSRYLIMGEGDQKNGVNKKESVKEDLFEAIFGAVALDCNYDLEVLLGLFGTMHEPESYLFDDARENFVSLIQEWTLWKYNTTPCYYYDKYTVPLGYDNMPKVNGLIEKENIPLGYYPKFYCLMKLGDYGVFFIGYGDSKSEARRRTCKKAYKHLKKRNQLFTIKDEIEQPSKEKAINQLETLTRRGHFEIPEYKFTETHDKDGNPIWQATCIIEDFEKVFNATSSSKKKAKKEAAFKMLNYVLENYEED